MNSALETVRSWGVPDSLFIAICEFIEQDLEPVGTPDNSIAVRFAPNTRAHALTVCRVMMNKRMESAL